MQVCLCWKRAACGVFRNLLQKRFGVGGGDIHELKLNAMNNEPTHITDIAMLSGGTITIFGGRQIDCNTAEGREILEEGGFTVFTSETPYHTVKPPRSLFGRMVEWVKNLEVWK